MLYQTTKPPNCHQRTSLFRKAVRQGGGAICRAIALPYHQRTSVEKYRVPLEASCRSKAKAPSRTEPHAARTVRGPRFMLHFPIGRHNETTGTAGPPSSLTAVVVLPLASRPRPGPSKPSGAAGGSTRGVCVGATGMSNQSPQLLRNCCCRPVLCSATGGLGTTTAGSTAAAFCNFAGALESTSVDDDRVVVIARTKLRGGAWAKPGCVTSAPYDVDAISISPPA